MLLFSGCVLDDPLCGRAALLYPHRHKNKGHLHLKNLARKCPFAHHARKKQISLGSKDSLIQTRLCQSIAQSQYKFQ